LPIQEILYSIDPLPNDPKIGAFMGWFSIVLSLVLGSVSPGTGQQPGQWEMTEFVVYLWGAPDIPDLETRARTLAEAGFTVVDWDQSHLAVLKNHHLKAMIHNADPQLARALSSDSSVWGYHCVDEPWPESTFAPLTERIKGLNQADPHHPAFVNMLSVGGEYLRVYMETVKPQLLSFDYYQWWWGRDRFFEKLEQFREAALRANIPLGSCIETSANPQAESGDHSYASGNATKLRCSVYCNLAYGVKSIQWFSATYMFVAGSGELTETGRDVVALNRELKKLGPVLIGLDSVDVFHSRPAHAGTRTIPKDYWVQVTGEDHKAPVVLGAFVDQHEVDFLYLVNCDCERSNQVSIKLQSKWLGIAPWNEPKKYHYSIQRFDRPTEQWQTVSSSSSQGFNAELAPGDGELFRIETGFLED
jgi:hypothetical protein